MPMPYDSDRALREISRSDPVLGKYIKEIGPFRMTPRRPRDPFRALLRSIVYQQLSGIAAGAIESRVLDLFDQRRPSADALLKIPEVRLRGAGLSRPKIGYMRDLAARTVAGEIPSARKLGVLPDEEIIAHLIRVKGIGRWTVQMMLMANYGRPDVLPVDDLGVRKGFMRCYRKRRMPTPVEVEKWGQRWAPWRSVASWYLWRIDEQGRSR